MPGLKTRFVRKRCTRCCHVAMVKPRVRTCWLKRDGFSIYACGGTLELAPIKRTPKPKPSKVEMLNRELLKTRRYLADALRRQKKAQKAVTVYAAKITKLIAQIAAAPPPGSRGIRFGEEVAP